MSTPSDDLVVARIVEALEDVGLEAIFVGSVAAALKGAPILTQDIDLLVRDTEPNREKARELAERLGLSRPVPVSPLARTLRTAGRFATIDLLFDELSGGLSFNALRSRAIRVSIRGRMATVARLDDIVRSKEAAGRPKDLAQLPILRDTLKLKGALESGD